MFWISRNILLYYCYYSSTLQDTGSYFQEELNQQDGGTPGEVEYRSEELYWNGKDKWIAIYWNGRPSIPSLHATLKMLETGYVLTLQGDLRIPLWGTPIPKQRTIDTAVFNKQHLQSAYRVSNLTFSTSFLNVNR